MVGVLACGGVFAAKFLASKKRLAAEQDCFLNIQFIDTAKESYAMLNEVPSGTEIMAEDIAGNFPGGKMPECPAGGNYTVGAPGDIPCCSAHASMCARIRINEQALQGTQRGYALYVEEE